jgi:hypothetical protein
VRAEADSARRSRDDSTVTEGAGPFLATSDLERVMALLLAAVREKHGDQIDLDGGLYWRLPLDGPDRMPDEPGEPVVGDLVDDVQEALSLLDGDRVVFLWHDLDHMAQLIRRISTLDLPGQDPER